MVWAGGDPWADQGAEAGEDQQGHQRDGQRVGGISEEQVQQLHQGDLEEDETQTHPRRRRPPTAASGAAHPSRVSPRTAAAAGPQAPRIEIARQQEDPLADGFSRSELFRE